MADVAGALDGEDEILGNKFSPVFKSFFLGEMIERGVELNGIKELLVINKLVFLPVFGVKNPSLPVRVSPTGSADVDHDSQLVSLTVRQSGRAFFLFFLLSR